MNNILNEELGRMRELAGIISEQQVNTQQIQQAKQKASQVFDANLKASLDAVIKQLPTTLSNYAKTGGDKDGSLEIKGTEKANSQQQKQSSLAIKEDSINEAVGALAASVALSAPTVINLMGKAGKWTGKKLNQKWLQLAGDKMHKFGEKWHHAYEGYIYKLLKKMIPNAKEETLKKASSAVFMSIIATMGLVSGAGAAGFAAKGEVGLAGAEGALASVKSGEVATHVAKALPRIIAQYFA